MKDYKAEACLFTFDGIPYSKVKILEYPNAESMSVKYKKKFSMNGQIMNWRLQAKNWEQAKAQILPF